MELKGEVTAIIGILLIGVCILLVAAFIKWLCSLEWTLESASKRAGRHGEEIAVEMISQVLREGDSYKREKSSSTPKDRANHYIIARRLCR